MAKKLTFGARELYCIFYSVVYLHFGLVKVQFYFFFLNIVLSVSTQRFCIFYFEGNNEFQYLQLSETEKGIFDAILQGDIDFDSAPWPSISSSAKDLVQKMLTQDPKKRITSAQVLGMIIM